MEKKQRMTMRERERERERERAYQFGEVEARGEERKNVKKKTGYLGLFTGSKKKGYVCI